MAQEYWIADEVQDIVDQYLKYHKDLVGAKIACIFKEKATKSDGVPLVGKIQKVTRKYQPLMDEPYDFILEIGADAWVELNVSQKEAWVDHLLEHAYGVEDEKTGEMTWKKRKPELMGFPSVIHRHGVDWMPGLAKIATLNVPKVTFQTPKKRREEQEAENSKSEEKNGSATEEFEDLMSDLN